MRPRNDAFQQKEPSPPKRIHGLYLVSGPYGVCRGCCLSPSGEQCCAGTDEHSPFFCGMKHQWRIDSK